MGRLHHVSPVLRPSTRLTVGYRTESWYAGVIVLVCTPQLLLALAAIILFKYVDPVHCAHFLTPGLLVYLSFFLFLLSLVYGEFNTIRLPLHNLITSAASFRVLSAFRLLGQSLPFA